MTAEIKREIEIEGRLNVGDYFRASLWYSFSKIYMKVLAGVAVILLFVFVAAAVQRPTNPPFGLLFVPAVVLLVTLSTYLNARRGIASNKSLGESIRYTFSDDGIEAAAQSSSGHTSWSNVLKAYESRRAFLLFISHNQFYTIPVRFFRDREQIAEFKELLLISTKAKLKR
ncbi:MAG: YcxB family protein [Pyrinomonadaceae bacterium]